MQNFTQSTKQDKLAKVTVNWALSKPRLIRLLSKHRHFTNYFVHTLAAN